MKILIPMIIASLAIVSSVSAATGSTSTGSTSTGSTSTGVVSTGSTSTGSTSTGSTSTGSTSTGVVSTGSISVPVSVKGAGGPIRAFNVTTQQFEMWPQCFPWAWLVDFYAGNIFMIYENQKACQEARKIDFSL